MLVVSDVYTLPDLLARAVNRDPDGDAVVFPDQRVTYLQLFQRATNAARSLKALGVDSGDSVGILMSNCQEFVDLLLGSQFIGAIPVPINARYKAKELAYVIDDAQLKVLMTTDRIVEHVDFVSLLQEAFPDITNQESPETLSLTSAKNLKSIVLFGGRSPNGMIDQETFESVREKVTEETIEINRSRLKIRDIAMMMYTSGTTANPKGCPITHEALVRPAMEAGRTRFKMTANDRMWDPLPMFHMSFVLPLIGCIDAGAALLTMEYFEPAAALAYMKSENATLNFASFPTIMEALLNHKDYDGEGLKIRIVNNVGPADLLVSMQNRMPKAIQISAYGLTECGGVVSFGHIEDSLEKRTETSGRLFRGIEAQIRDPETDEILGSDQQGEILIRGYCVFEGYHNAPEKNAEAFTSDGWFRTGDLCSLDDEGRITYHGRIKDMLKVGGENVAAVEIEGFLSHHPAIQLAQVVSAPDNKYVEVPAAFIQLKEGMSATEEEIIDFCKGQLSSFKIPRYVRFVTEWPMSATKIQKIRLREQIAAEL
ncbi:MAG TPA: AMP-binding protein [Acidimicrobiales bacterium]|nr:AMP-binding protein [Acidimicrobiales bacterium]